MAHAAATERETKTLDRVDTRPDEDESDGLAHIVLKDEQMRGYVGGQPIRALCGKVWVPTRDYQGLPICRACEKERDRRISGMRRMN